MEDGITMHITARLRALFTLRICSMYFALVMMAGSIALTGTLGTQEMPLPAPTPPASILINNVCLFDGVNDEIRQANLLIVGSKIKQITSGPLTPPPHSTVIDSGGRVLMPGLTDAHWHMTIAANTLENLQHADPGMMYANTVAEAHRTVLRGCTTVRDMAGPTVGIKAAIDAGVIPGPRVYLSGALISQTYGHGDFTPPYAWPKARGGR
jgi:imidazolonepropionase-like amidohydrolase